jgi:signal transduction histidine kinase
LLSQPFLNFVHPDDVAATVGAMGRSEAGMPIDHFENRYRKRDGDFVTLSWVATTDEVTGLIYAVARDMTAQVEARSHLARTVGFLNETGAIAKVGGWELDVATGELEWTDETFRILEVEKKSGQKPMLPEGLKLFTPQCQPIIERAVSRAIEFGEPYSLELEAQTAKGNVLWVFTNGKPNYVDGKIVSLSGTIQDIHERKMVELRYETERRRTLHDAKMASLGQLAASIAHELNNPIGIVSGYAEVALESPDLPSGVSDKLKRIMKTCERMAYIIRNLKRFSRSEEERQKHAPHSLLSIIQESVTLVTPRLKRDMIELNLECRDDIEIVCSEIEIEQVLVNLFNNSMEGVRDLPERWVKVAAEDRGSAVALLVTDSGAGMGDIAVDEIFAPFQTTKGESGGTGLGLAICREILKDHEATIEYEPRGGHTSFTITFPKTRSDAG